MGVSFPFKKTLIKFALERVFSRMDDVIEDQLAKQEVVKKIVVAINNDATLEEAINVYVDHANNPTVTKVDEIVDKILAVADDVIKDIRELPLTEVIAKYLDDITIPDFDDDPDNDISIAAFLLDIIEDVSTGEKGDEPR